MKFKKLFLLFTIIGITSSLFAQTVHYTRTGSKYHSKGCQYLRKSDYTCSLSEALGMGLSACSRCDPPTVIIKPKAKSLKKVVKKQSKKISYNFPSNYNNFYCYNHSS